MYALLVTAVAAGVIGWLLGYVLATRKTTASQRSVGRTYRPGEPADETRTLVGVIGQLAHELRNPLSSMKLNLQLLQEDFTQMVANQPDDPHAQRLLNRLETAADEASRLSQVLQDFLQFASKPTLDLQSCDLNVVLESLLDLFSPQASAHSVNVRVALSAEPLICKIDPTMFKQVVLNLFINAQQAMADGGDLIVRTSKLSDGRAARLEVIDTGPGILPEQIDRVFEPYYSTTQGGTGLGLPIVKTIVQAHGGTVAVSSHPGKGSDFYIDLPLNELGGTQKIASR